MFSSNATKKDEWKDAAPPTRNPWTQRKKTYAPAVSSPLAQAPQVMAKDDFRGRPPLSEKWSTMTDVTTPESAADRTPQQSAEESLSEKLPVLSSEEPKVIWKDAAPPSKNAWMSTKAWSEQKEVQAPVRKCQTPSKESTQLANPKETPDPSQQRAEAATAAPSPPKNMMTVEGESAFAKPNVPRHDVGQIGAPSPDQEADNDLSVADTLPSMLPQSTEAKVEPSKPPLRQPVVIVSSQWATRTASSISQLHQTKSDVQEKMIASVIRNLSQSLENFREHASQEVLLQVETAQKELREMTTRHMCGEDVEEELGSLTKEFGVALEVLGRLRSLNKAKSEHIARQYAQAKHDAALKQKRHAVEAGSSAHAELGSEQGAHCPESLNTVAASLVSTPGTSAVNVNSNIPSNRKVARLHKSPQRTSEKTALEMWRLRDYGDIQVHIRSPQWCEPPIPAFGLHRCIVEPECGWLKKAIKAAAEQQQDVSPNENADASVCNDSGQSTAQIRLNLLMNPILAGLCFGFAYTGKLVHDPVWEYQNGPNFREIGAPNPANPYDISTLVWSLQIYKAALQLQMPKLCCHIVGQIEELALNITEQTMLARRWGLKWHWAYIVEEFEHAMVHYLYNGNNLCGWEPLRVAVMALQDAITLRVGTVRNTVREMYWWVVWDGNDSRRAHQDWVDFKKKYGCVTAIKKGDLVPSREEMTDLIEARGHGSVLFDEYGLPIHHLANHQ